MLGKILFGSTFCLIIIVGVIFLFNVKFSWDWSSEVGPSDVPGKNIAINCHMTGVKMADLKMQFVASLQCS